MKWLDEAADLASMFGALGLTDWSVLDTAEVIQDLFSSDKLDIVRVDINDGWVAWCGEYANGWKCVTLAPKGDVHGNAMAVPRLVFFAPKKPFPATWITKGRQGTLDAKKAKHADIPFEEGGMCYATGPEGVHLARIAKVDGDEVWLEMHPGAPHEMRSETGMKWKTVRYNNAGAEADWFERQGRTYPNPHLIFMRAGGHAKKAEKAAEKLAAGGVRPVGKGKPAARATRPSGADPGAWAAVPKHLATGLARAWGDPLLLATWFIYDTTRDLAKARIRALGHDPAEAEARMKAKRAEEERLADEEEAAEEAARRAAEDED